MFASGLNQPLRSAQRLAESLGWKLDLGAAQSPASAPAPSTYQLSPRSFAVAAPRHSYRQWCHPVPLFPGVSQVPTGPGRVSPRLRQKEHQAAGGLQSPDIPILPHEPRTSSFRAALYPVGVGQVRLPREATPAASGRSTGSFASVHTAGKGREGLPAEREDVLSFSTIKLQIGGDSLPQGCLRTCQQHNSCSWMNCDRQGEASPDRVGPGTRGRMCCDLLAICLLGQKKGHTCPPGVPGRRDGSFVQPCSLSLTGVWHLREKEGNRELPVETGSAFGGRGRGAQERAARAVGAGMAGELPAQGGQVLRTNVPRGSLPRAWRGALRKGLGEGAFRTGR